jgi:hypothetical protein
VGDHDDGALVGDALAHAGRGEGTPLVDVKDLREVGRAIRSSLEGGLGGGGRRGGGKQPRVFWA